MRPTLNAFALLFLLSAPLCAAHFTSTNGNGVSVHSTPAEPPIAGIAEKLFIQLTDGKGAPLTNLDIVHERKLHIFIVGSDLATFAHMHPEENPEGFALLAQGIYVINYTYPYAGNYLLVADYTTQGINTISTIETPVFGEKNLPAAEYNFNTTRTFGDFTVSLELPDPLEAGKEAALTYHIERRGQPVQDLQMYLGAELHVFIVRADLQHVGHTHPYAPGHTLHVGVMPQRYIGPNIPIRHTFPEPGVYVLFGQFEAGDEVTTTRFLLRVDPAEETGDALAADTSTRRNRNILSQATEIAVIVAGLCIVFPFLLLLGKRLNKKQ